MDGQLVNYIKDSLAKGYSIAEIRENLLLFGTKEDEIDALFKQLNVRPQPASVQTAQPDPVKKTVQSQTIIKPSETQKNNAPEVPKWKSKLKKLIIPLLVILVVFLAISLKMNLLQPHGIRRSLTGSAKLHKQYYALWKQLFSQQNDIDDDYFKVHVIPRKTSLDIKAADGEQFYIDYDFKVGWATFNEQDNILVKPKGQDHYLTDSELKTGVATLSGELKPVYNIGSIVAVDDIIPKSEVDKQLVTCRTDMVPASTPLRISAFSSADSPKIRLLYRAKRQVSNNQVVMGEVDLVSGELNCYEATVQY